MGIRAFLEKVQEHLDAALDKDGAKKPAYALGFKSTLMQHGDPPEIKWVPRGGPTKGDATGGNDVTTGRRLAMREVAIDAHIWCEGIDECETMANRLIDALQVATWGSYRVVGELWGSAEEDRAEFTQNGDLLILTVEIRMPWTRALTATTKRTITLDVTPSDPIEGSE